VNQLDDRPQNASSAAGDWYIAAKMPGALSIGAGLAGANEGAADQAMGRLVGASDSFLGEHLLAVLCPNEQAETWVVDLDSEAGNRLHPSLRTGN
jgi:hypothetical protein